jgi:hypothetical protein
MLPGEPRSRFRSPTRTSTTRPWQGPRRRSRSNAWMHRRSCATERVARVRAVARAICAVPVAAQIALCAGLLAGAGLLTRSLWKMTTAALGFDRAGVLTAAIRLPSHDYSTPEARIQFLEQLTDRLRVLPGVDTVATAESVPTAVRRRVGVVSEP